MVASYRPLALLALLLCWLGHPRQVWAQELEEPRPRQGYVLSFGLHGAMVQLWEDGESIGPMYGTSYSLRAAHMLLPHLGLGLDAYLGNAEDGPYRSTFGGLALSGEWEMLDNLSLRSSIGMGVVAFREQDSDDGLQGVYGSGYTLAVAYDLFFGRSRQSGGIAVTPILTTRFVPSGSMSGLVGLLGLELNYWEGLPSNRLELPPGEGYEK